MSNSTAVATINMFNTESVAPPASVTVSPNMTPGVSPSRPGIKDRSPNMQRFRKRFLGVIGKNMASPSLPKSTKGKSLPSTSTSSSTLPSTNNAAVSIVETSVIITSTITATSTDPSPTSNSKEVSPQPAVTEVVPSTATRKKSPSSSTTKSGTQETKSTDPTSKDSSPVGERENASDDAKPAKQAASTNKTITKSTLTRPKLKSKSNSQPLPAANLVTKNRTAPERGLLVPNWWVAIEGGKLKEKKGQSNSKNPKAPNNLKTQRGRPRPVKYSTYPQLNLGEDAEDSSVDLDAQSNVRTCSSRSSCSTPALVKTRAEREMQMARNAVAEGKEKGGRTGIGMDSINEINKEDLSRRGGNGVMFPGNNAQPRKSMGQRVGVKSEGRLRGDCVNEAQTPLPRATSYPTHLHRAVDEGNIFGGTKLDTEQAVVVRLAPMEWYIRPRDPYETDDLFWESVRCDLEFRRREGDGRARRWGALGPRRRRWRGSSRRSSNEGGEGRLSMLAVKSGGLPMPMDTIVEEREEMVERVVERRRSL